MCKGCKGKDKQCICRGKFAGKKIGQSPKIAKDGKISNQKGAFGKGN